MSERDYILLVEDEPVQRLLAVGLLEEYYDVGEAASGVEALEKIRERKPDLVLMDIVMPEMNGLQACQLIRDDPEIADTPVLFLTAEITLEDRLAVYSVGGEDFVGKPFNPTELLAKVEVALRNNRTKKRLSADVKMAFDTAMTAMTSSGEMGSLLQCVRQIMAGHELLSVAEAILGTCSEYGLRACLMIKTSDELVARNQDGEASQLEASTLNTLRSCGRIVSMKQYAAFNYGHLTLMVTNMPLDDPDRSGRMRDNLALLAEAADARVTVLDAQSAEIRQRQTVQRLLEESVAALTAIDLLNIEQRRKAYGMLDVMVERAEEAFYGMGLSEAQELLMDTLLRDTAYELKSLLDQGLAIDQHLTKVRQSLAELTPASIISDSSEAALS